MSRKPIGIALVIAAALVVFIIASAGLASAKDVCLDALSSCTAKCGRSCNGKEPCLGNCWEDCLARFNVCDAQHYRSGIPPPENAPPTNPTGTPPKGGLKPVNVGGIKDPGGGGSSPTKPIRTLKPVDLGGAKQSGDGTGSGTATIYRSHVSGRRH